MTPSSEQSTYGADRLEPLRCGYIGDHCSGGLVLHDENPAPSEQYNRTVTIDLGYGIPHDQALDLAERLSVLLREIHEAQGRYR